MEALIKEIDAALHRERLSARAASLKATGNPAFIRDLQRGHSPTAKNLVALCKTLGLEFYVGPPREAAVPEAIAEALGLPADATVAAAVEAIKSLEAPIDGGFSDSGEQLDDGMEPVRDLVLARMLAAWADAWEEAPPRFREDMVVRWETCFSDLAKRVLSLSGRRLSRLAGSGGRSKGR